MQRDGDPVEPNRRRLGGRPAGATKPCSCDLGGRSVGYRARHVDSRPPRNVVEEPRPKLGRPKRLTSAPKLHREEPGVETGGDDGLGGKRRQKHAAYGIRGQRLRAERSFHVRGAVAIVLDLDLDAALRRFHANLLGPRGGECPQDAIGRPTQAPKREVNGQRSEVRRDSSPERQFGEPQRRWRTSEQAYEGHRAKFSRSAHRLRVAPTLQNGAEFTGRYRRSFSRGEPERIVPMSISSIASTATQALTPTSSAASTAKAQRSRSSLPPAKDGASVSGPAQTLNKLQALQKSDPAKFKEVMSAISDKLSSAAQSSTNPAEQKALTDAAARFKSAGDSGDLSALAPQKGGGGGRAKRSSDAPPGGGAQGAPPPKAAAQPSANAAVTSPADANGDGKVSAAEQAAYDAKQATGSAGSPSAQRAYGHGHGQGGGGGAFAQVGAIVDSVLSGVADATG